MNHGLILGLGELLWDCFPDEERPGGAPANFAYHAAQLGFEGGVLSRVGQDRRGQEIVSILANSGVKTEWIQWDDTHPTGYVTVDVSSPSQPRFTIHEGVAWDYLEASPDWQQAIDSAVVVCFGTLAQRLPVSRAAIRSLLAGQKKKRLVVFDVNLRQQYFDRPLIEASLELARLVKLNDEEVRVLCELLELPAKTEEEFCRHILDRFGVEAVCVTRGAQGCLMVDQSGMAEVPGIPVKVADTVGAGDAFTAAWVTSRMMGWNLAQQAEFANRVGALVASLPGGMPSVKEEYQRLLKL